ncbi:MAG: DUF2069 domain-containing protein [Gammaproteobacteria bacterium]|nr:DUF2069 domain-containing protein [Gammaproteobacteria bacterium]
MKQILIFRWLTLAGYFGLMALIFYRHLVSGQTAPEQISVLLLIQLGPLMFPLRGLLHGKLYTHAWSMYLALFYFVIGIWYAGAEHTRTFGIMFSSLSLVFFTGTVFYTRFRAKQEKQNNDQTTA